MTESSTQAYPFPEAPTEPGEQPRDVLTQIPCGMVPRICWPRPSGTRWPCTWQSDWTWLTDRASAKQNRDITKHAGSLPSLPPVRIPQDS